MNFVADLKNYIKDLITDFFKDGNYFIVDVLISAGDKIAVYVDKLDGHIEISQCAKLSRYLENDLESNNKVKENYKLEVSSPGLDNPFKVHQQYLKNINRDIAVWDKSNTKLEGKLVEVKENEITLLQIKKSKNKKTEEKEMTITFENIVKTKVKISFKK